MLVREVPGHPHGMTFGNIKFHLPIGLPLGKAVQAILKIFLFPLTLPCFSGKGRSVGIFFFLTSQILYPLNLYVHSPIVRNKTKCTNNSY